ncbi:DUF3024 domain-containing protein [Segniliparus rotundus]|uniref:DUF3024 domain-containing protein n=1 Tax=Segniliparus rotundus TaxID=286802 RepID=UPI0002E3AD6D|nr:DUF3024 domain-containing protein [Segniliparus rotundus]
MDRFPIAGLRYIKTTKLWELYWRDRNMRFRRYEPLSSSHQIETFLDWIGTSGDPLFWN